MSEPYRREDGLPTIGLALIVKDEEETLPRLLDSVGWPDTVLNAGEDAQPADERALKRPEFNDRGWWVPGAAVDFIVVCDTGSSDRTKEIAAERGCLVIDFEWCDDFSAARQASYDALPPVDFTLWADADDVIEGAEQLRSVAASLPPHVAATVHRYDYAFDADGNVTCELWRERLVRGGIGASWHLPIHEVLRVPGEMLHIPQVVWKHVQPPDRERDPERNYKILKADYEKAEAAGRAPDPRTIAYLGTEALALGRPDEAAECFREYLSRDDAAWDEERCQVAHKLSIALRFPRAGDTPEQEGIRLEVSAEAAQRAISERPDWADGYIDLAEIALRRREFPTALRFCETALRLDPPQTLLIINPMDYSFAPRLMKAVALGELGQIEGAWEAIQGCLSEAPHREDVRAQATAIQGSLAAKKAEELVLQLREVLVRHDENWKATKLMECVPYFAWDRPAIAQARLDQREMTLHAVDPGVYGAYYRDNPNEAPFERQGVEIEKAHETFQRVDFLRRGLAEQQEAA